jgi:leucyl aminopeptidase
MTTIRLSDGIVKDDVLVVGLASKSSKSSKAGAVSLQIESGDLAIDTKVLMQALSDLGATGKADEVIKVPSTSTRLIVFTGLGKVSTHYDHEVLRRAAGAAARALTGNSSATFSLPAKERCSCSSDR